MTSKLSSPTTFKVLDDLPQNPLFGDEVNPQLCQRLFKIKAYCYSVQNDLKRGLTTLNHSKVKSSKAGLWRGIPYIDL